MSSEETLSDAFTEHLASRGTASAAESDSETLNRMSDFSNAVDLLAELENAGLEDLDQCLLETVDCLGKLADSVEASLSNFDNDDPDILDLVDFVVESCNAVRVAVASDQSGDVPMEQLEFLKEAIELRMESRGDSVETELEGQLPDDDGQPWESDVIAPSEEEIAALLSGLDSPTRETSDSDSNPSDDVVAQQSAASDPSNDQENQSCSAAAPTVGHSKIPLPAIDYVDIDAELREAFMDDATRGLESMEQALLDLESRPGDDGPVKTIGRELHTIKGASACIGMSNLASYIHDIEELIRETQDARQAVSPELLLPHVDVIRARVDGEEVALEATSLGPVGSTQAPSAAAVVTADAITPSDATRAATNRSIPLANSHGEDETVRVKASQLNRLMDMLSELVMLRNQRDTEISALKGIHDELIHSVSRIRMLSHEGETRLASENLTDPTLAEDGVSFSYLNEVANDVLESAQYLRECYGPVDDGNQAVSQFIRNFRLELVQLRRTPVSGLFRRLHRAVSDAARTEQKQVRVELIGENTGIERSLQERIFEPLLHIVRNSVSHGIEFPDERVAAGKPPQGVIRLHAHSGPDLLVIEVRDDGRGLDYDAIRRRGIERGLIDGDKSISRAELARLIFNSGFSTRDTADQLSGRGVGMDVVASTLERMRGWVEVESENGSGSMIRLSLPLPSMIQHAMVFRSGGQLFALPAQSVRRTGEFDSAHDAKDLNRILALPGCDSQTQQDHSRRAIIELATGLASCEGESVSDFALLVDHVLGPEEVVVRPMPQMLKSHPLCSGATLSGMGEVVLMLDPRRLAEAAMGTSEVIQSSQPSKRPAPKLQAKVLVVDDSKSARLCVARALKKYPVSIVQVEDGQAALEMLAKETFATVFSDIDMPGISGLELLQTIKSDPRLESIPVIMISSRSIEIAGKQALSIGATEYIQKPLIPEQFDGIVGELAWAKK